LVAGAIQLSPMRVRASFSCDTERGLNEATSATGLGSQVGMVDPVPIPAPAESWPYEGRARLNNSPAATSVTSNSLLADMAPSEPERIGRCYVCQRDANPIYVPVCGALPSQQRARLCS